MSVNIKFSQAIVCLALFISGGLQVFAQSSPNSTDDRSERNLSKSQEQSQAHNELLIPQEFDKSIDSPNQAPLKVNSEVENQPDKTSQRQSKTKTITSLSKVEVNLAFDRGRNSYLYGSYKETVKNLSPILYPKVLIADPESLSLAYEYLALAYFYLGKQKLAIQTFKDLIYSRPEHQLDPVRVPPNAVSLYNQLHDELQSDLQERQEALERQNELEREREQQKLKQSVILEQQVNQRLVAFLPFGAGQFQNREPGLGYFFLGSELVAVGLSIGFFWGVESLRELDGRFSRQSYPLAQSLQRAQIISGGIALGLMVSGIIQALWRYQDRYNLGNYLDLDSEAESFQEQEVVTDEDLPFSKTQPSR